MKQGRFAIGALAVALAAGCSTTPTPTGSSSSSGGMGGDGPAWQVVYDGAELGGAILSVWGTSPSNVYAVGGPLGNAGFEAIALHYDGAKWERLKPGGEDSFWWVSGSGPDDVWMIGEKGRITHYDGATFKELPRPTASTLWGLWAAGPNDAWAVGGLPGKGMAADNDLVLHWDGSAWKKEALPMPLGRSLNKVWGTSSSDLYAIGEAATIWHRQGTTWSLETNPAKSNLLTAFGCSASEVYVVGGRDVLRSDGKGTWASVEAHLSNSANGVTCAGAGDVLVVGFGGLKDRLAKGAWTNDFRDEPYGDLHGSWAEGPATFWAVGGDFASSPKPMKARNATIARFGRGGVAVVTP